jgi:hypothetical protein
VRHHVSYHVSCEPPIYLTSILSVTTSNDQCSEIVSKALEGNSVDDLVEHIDTSTMALSTPRKGFLDLPGGK